MSKISRLKVPCYALQGLKYKALTNVECKSEVNMYYETIESDLSLSPEHDRVFDNVDLIEGLVISEIINPNKTLNTKLIVNLVTPTRIYREKLKIKNAYKDKTKG